MKPRPFRLLVWVSYACIATALNGFTLNLVAASWDAPGRPELRSRIMAAAFTLLLSVLAAAGLARAQLNQPTPLSPERATEWLRKRLLSALTTEAAALGLHAKDRLAVSWSDRSAPSHRGYVDSLIRSFLSQSASPNTLLILGDAGSGKSIYAIQLAIGCLKHQGGPIPVLSTAADWRARDQDHDQFLKGELTRILDNLGAHNRIDDPTVDDLVMSGSVYLVLDALDEVDHRAAGEILIRLEAARLSGRRFIATSRPEAFAEALTRAGSLLNRDVAAFERELVLQRLSTEAIFRYLAPEGEAERWRAVEEAVRGASDGAIASVLQVPLMVWLAKRHYYPRKSNPSELVNLADSEAVTSHLIRSFVPALYSNEWTRNTRAGNRNHMHVSVASAERWLGTLAGLAREDLGMALREARLRELVKHRWLGLAGPHIPAVAAVSIIFYILAALKLIELGLPSIGAFLCLSYSAIWLEKHPMPENPGAFLVAGHLVLFGWVVPTVLLMPNAVLAVTFALATPAVFLLLYIAIGATVIAWERVASGTTSGGWTTERSVSNRRTLLKNLLSLVIGVAITAGSGALIAWVSAQLLSVVGLGEYFSLQAPLVAAAIWGLTFWQWVATHSGVFRSSIYHLLAVRAFLSFRRLIPWRLGRFLRDAQRRGVMRSSRGRLEFRHAILASALREFSQLPDAPARHPQLLPDSSVDSNDGPGTSTRAGEGTA